MSDDQAFRDFLLADKSASRNADPALVPGRVNARVGVTAQPDAQAQFGDLAKRYGVPAAVVENDPEVWKQRAAADEAQQHIDASPKLGQWLGEDPQRAKVSHDSLEAMAGVDHAFSAVFPKNGSDADKLRYWQAVGQRAPLQIKAAPSAASVAISKVRNFGLTLTAGIDSTFAGLDALAAAGFKSVGLDRAAAASKNDAKLGMTRARSNSRAGWGGTLEGGFYQAVESLPVSLGALALGATTGPQSGLAFVGAVSGGQSYLKAQEAGLGHWQSVGFGALDAAVEVGTEAIPLTRFLQNTAVGTSIGKRLLENVVEENVGEQVATALQDLNQWAQIDSNKGKTFADYLAERPDAALQTAIATTMSVGIINASVTAGEFAARRSERKQQQAANAQRAEVLLTGLKELAEAAPIAKRDVSTFESWVRSAAEGTEATDVYIDARTLVETLQQSGLTEPEIVAALPSIRTELPTALLANGDVRIPIEEFAARSGELGQSLIPHLRLDPNDKSVAEAQEFMQSAQDEFQKETEKAFAEINADDQFRQSTERVADAVYEKLNQAGRFTPDTNRTYASLHAAFFARLASDLGTTPEEAAARYPLLIQSEGVGEGPGVMDQPQEADEAAAPQVFDQGERAPPALYPAIRHNGKIYKSVSDHLSALSQIPDPAERAKASADGDNRVYVTERGKVLDRFRAQEYAQAHDLISPDAPSWARTSPDLISENLRKPGRYYADTPREGYDQTGQPLPATIEVDGKQRSTVNSNGQPLAATEEGVRAFWEWFGDSKVVDANGDPLVVYHGTAADFDQFSKAADAKHIELPGFFFTPDPSIAERFAASASRREFRDDDGYIAGYEGAAVVPVYLSIKNPAEINLTDAETGKMTRESEVRENLVAAQKAGHDGAIIRGWADGSGDAQYVAFSPTQIKSIHNRGTFDPNDPRILYQSGQPIFYSALQRTVESSKQAKAPASQWKSILQNAPGVKAEELEWSGILDLFDEDPKRVWTRDELVQLLDAGGIKVDEVVLGGEPDFYSEDNDYFVGEQTDDGDYPVYSPQNEFITSFPTEDEAEETARTWSLGTAVEVINPQFKGWSSDPSNDTYRELLITLPIGEGRNPDRAPSTHWDQPNVVAHARFMDKRDASGDRVLFIEEVQSDWHQKGRDQGYAVRKEPVDTATLERIRDEADTVFNAARVELAHALMAEGRDVSTVASSGYLFREAIEFSAGTPVRNALSAMQTAELRRTEAQIAFNNARDANASAMSGIPNAPFKSSWPALVMKRMIRWAVDNGYTKIAWTTGEEQADRYDLAQATGAITARLDEESGKYWVSFERGSAGEILSAQSMAENHEGRAVMSVEQMQSAFGKDITQRIVDGAVDGKYAKLHDADLKIGGEGMKAFYDRNLVNITNDLIKKYGVKVGKVEVLDALADSRITQVSNGYMLHSANGNRTIFPDFETASAAKSAEPVATKTKHGFEISDKLAEAAAGGFPLFQGPRGQIRVGDVTQDPTVITLLQRADLSTFLHESGHFFLEVLMHVAAQPDAPQRVVDDMNAFLKWTGVESMGQWSKMTTNEKRPHHERFARGVEAFLYEGNAPSLELKSLFQRFRDWLKTVYRSLTQLNVELTPEIRGVFNRMLASDQAIREAESQVGYTPILTEKPEGMADEEWEAYQRLGADATSEAVSDLERRSLRDMRYAGKAAGRELKRLQREIKAMREAMRTEVEADMAREPVYRAQEFMKKGLLDGEPVEGPTKMLISEVEALYEDRPKLYVDEVKRALGFGQYGMLAKDGIHPEQIAELFGFTSADHMIQDLMLAEPIAKAIETEIDTRMLERYGDLTSEKALQDAVDQAIHNDVRGRFVATEFAALSKAPGKPRVMAAAARSLAEKAVSRLKVRNLRPAQYEAAERRAAKAAAEASAKGDIPLAASEKRNQLINFYGAKASRDALTDVDKMVRYFKKFETKGTRQNLDVGYLDQIDKLLERFDLRKSVTNRQADKRKSLKAWVDRQKEMGFDPLIDEELLDEANRIPYREMTVEEMRGLRDTIKNIEHLARLKKKLLLAKDQREFADAVNDVAGAIRANAYKNVAEIIGAKSWWEKRVAQVKDILAMHRKMANWAHVMDGNKMGGPVWERFIRPMNDRGAWEASAKAKATADLGALFDRLKGQNLNKRSFVPAIGKSLSLQDRLMVALNMGNEGNLQRLMDGERWEQDRLNAVLEPLTQEHWAFVQAVWDYLDSFYPEVAAKEVRVSGVAPQKVEAVPFERQLADGSTVQMRGGYFPIKYDPDRSSKAEADTAAEVLQQMTQGLYTAAQTRRGHTKARAEQVDRPVRKDFGVIFEHVNQVIHDLAWHEYLIDANRLLRAVDIDTAIREAHGPETLRWMRKALEDIALGDIRKQEGAFDPFIRHIRTGASVAAMGWNLWTSMIQPLGLTQTASRIGTRWLLVGIGRVMGDAAHIESTARWVYERSEFMRNRGATQQREIAEIRNSLSDKSPWRKAAELVVPAAAVDTLTGSYFTLIAKAQLIADLPTWVGQYEKSMDAGETEERAAALADQAVLDSQGGGQIKDLAGVQRGSELMRLLTNFYGYFNTTYNLMADRTARLRREGVRDLPAFAVDQLMLTALPSIMATLLYQLVKGDDDDWEKIPDQIAADLFGYMTGLMVGLREFGSLMQDRSNYQGPAGARFFKEAFNLSNQVRQGDADEALYRAANQLGGILFRYPATAVDRFVRGSAALEQGEAGPLALVVGPPPKQ